MIQDELKKTVAKVMTKYGANPNMLRVNVALYDDSLRNDESDFLIEIERGDGDDFLVEIGYFKNSPLEQFEKAFEKLLSSLLSDPRIHKYNKRFSKAVPW